MKKNYFYSGVKRYLRFIIKNNYIPNFERPNTFNEKIHHRKKYSNNKLFSICSDKIAVKKYVAEILSEDIIIETLYESKTISCDKVSETIKDFGDCVLKANHNSGPVFILTESSTDEEIRTACESINRQLKDDYGQRKNERWYSAIEPKVLIEKKISAKNKYEELNDYKFHVFKQKNGSFKIVLQVDFERSTCHHRTLVDESFNWLPFSIQRPCLNTSIPKPDNYLKMLEIVKKLAEPFSYVRVDLYNVGGDIYFGEMTFAHGSGNEIFSHPMYDDWMGALWEINTEDYT